MRSRAPVVIAIWLSSFVAVAAQAATTLLVVRGSGEFQTLESKITVTKPEALTMQWSTDQAGATGGTWRIMSGRNATVATGEAPAPAAGHFIRFSIGADAFLKSTPPALPVKFFLTIVPHNAAQQPLGSPSAAVIISQVPEGPPAPPISFGRAMEFPSVEMVKYEEKIGLVPQTQLHFAVADMVLRVSNHRSASTDPVTVGVQDENGLMRQSGPNPAVPALKPGTSQTVTVHLSAILPPPTSQLPEEEQYRKWGQDYQTRCGPDWRGVLNWNGPTAQAPVNDRREMPLSLEGWADYSSTSVNAAICDSTQCVRPCQMARNIRKQLDGHVVGYAFFAGQFPKFHSYGHARTSADGGDVAFAANTKITVASVSKLVTAIGAMAVLDRYGVSVDAAIGPYLPADWSPAPYVKNLTFAQLLSHRSGIKHYGNVPTDYTGLKTFFTQPVNNASVTTCQPSSVTSVSNPINPNDMTPCYSNYNFAIFRVLLPKVAGLPEDNTASRPQTLANQYVKLVQQNVFDKVGQKNVDCRPPASQTYAFAYNYPGDHRGHDWGDVSLICGAAGWYLSVEDMAKVLLSINAKDGKILAETPAKTTFDTMRTRSLGWDKAGDTELEKNGGWGAGCDKNGNDCGSITTSVAIFGPVKGPRVVGVLFINSDISGGPSAGKSADQVLENAYNAALAPKP